MSASLFPVGGGAVTVTVEVAFATANPLTTSPSWTDISAYVMEVTTKRGRWDRMTQRCDAGRATIRLRNEDRRFDPLYAAGPYFGNLVPMKQIRVRATYAAVTYDVWRGFVEGWPQDWDPQYPTYAESTITAVDAFGYLATTDAPDRYAIEVLADSPFAFWRCSDEGNTMRDASPNGRHGSWTGPQSATSTGMAVSDGGARLMEGVEVGVDELLAGYSNPASGTWVDTAAAGIGNDVSFDAWMYVATAYKPDTSIVVMPNGGIGWLGAAVGSNLSLLFDDDNGFGTFSASRASYANPRELGVSLPRDRWFHVAATFEYSTSTLTVYVDGRQVGSTTATGTSLVWPATVGWAVGNADETYGLDFSIDEMAVYSSVLSAARVAAHHNAGSNGYQAELSGTRIGVILDHVDWPSGLRTIGTGNTYLAGGPTSTTSAIDYLQQIAADTEQGRLFVDGAGSIVFRDRSYGIETTAANTSQATFGDSGSELRYTAIGLDGGHIEQIRNAIEVTGQAGGTALVESSSSVTAYGRRLDTLSTLHYDVRDAKNLGQWRISLFDDPSYVFTQLELAPRTDAANLYPQALGREIGDRVTVVRRPQGVGSAISQERWIEGVEHHITPEDWRTRFYLAEPVATISGGGWFTFNDGTRDFNNGVFAY